MKVSIDEDKCVGAGQCVLTAPEIYDQRDEDGVAFPIVAEPEEHHRAEVEESARVCPAAAIRIED
ncbi:ferredoxin [Salinifilum ghardaiensis]